MRMFGFVWDMFVSHKMRFLLTISGIVVGVASLVTLASLLHVGEGVLRSTSMQASGEDIVTVNNDWRSRQTYPNEKRLDLTDLRNLDDSLLLQETDFTAVYGMNSVSAKVGTVTATVRGVGVQDPVFSVHGLQIAEGRPFGPADYQGTERVAVVGSKVKEKLPDLEVGGNLSVDGDIYVVVGILDAKPAMGPGEEWSWNNRVLIPARIFNLSFNPGRRPNSIVGKVNAPLGYDGSMKELLGTARDMVRLILMTTRTYENFDMGDAQQSGSTEQIIFMVIKLLIFLTTVFSMLVGGINIMNIMLVTVTERTREIGIRRALGATRNDILRQFLAETLGVTLTGAVIGTLTALGALSLAAELLTRFVVPWPFYVESWSLALALGFSIVIGLVFGISPALRAANLDPVEALRYE